MGGSEETEGSVRRVRGCEAAGDDASNGVRKYGECERNWCAYVAERKPRIAGKLRARRERRMCARSGAGGGEVAVLWLRKAVELSRRKEGGGEGGRWGRREGVVGL